MRKCVVTRRLPGEALERLSAEYETFVWPSPLPPTPEELREIVRDAHALICLLTDRVNADVFDSAPNLMVVANYAVGFDNIDVAEAARRSITVTNTPDVLTDATADFAFALLASGARRISEADRFVREGKWKTWEPGVLLGAAMKGAVVGVIGLGRIGSAFAERASGFGMTVLGHEISDDRAHLLELLSKCDFVSLHCPLTAENRHMIDREALSVMKPDAVLVNTARGGLLDLEAVAEALQNDQLGAVAIDVAEVEPIPPSHPIFQAPRVTITPHIASGTRVVREKMVDLVVDNVLAVLRGDPPLTPVVI